MKIKHVIATLTALAAVSQANAYDNTTNGRDARVRCNAFRNSFVLNKANVNALVAISCAGLSHTANERKQMIYEDSMTTFHQWSTTNGPGKTIFVKGYCAIPLTELKTGSFDRRKIDLKFEQIEDGSDRMDIEVSGSVSGKTLTLDFGNNDFMDNQCAFGRKSTNRLTDIDLGLMLGIPSAASLADMIRSRSTGIRMGLLADENWVQGQVSSYFSGFGVQYLMSQTNGRKFGLSAASGGSGSELRIRTANFNVTAMDVGDGYFELKKDSFGTPTGFLNDRAIYRRDSNGSNSQNGKEIKEFPNNHKFQAYSIDGGSAMIGCSQLVYKDELALSQEADMESCKEIMGRSRLANTRAMEVAVKATRAEYEQNKVRFDQAKLISKIERYIERNFPASKNYSDRPGIYEQNRARWSQEDISRGYVVVQRSYEIDKNTSTILVTEHRMVSGGKTSVKRHSIPISSLQ